MAYTYILHSPLLDKFYIGHTDTTPEERLEKHLTGHNGFTAKAKDWKIVWTAHFESKSEAYAMQRRIKTGNQKR